jgi:hypothetical protein
MSKTSYREINVESLYQEGDGYVFIKFIKPLRLAREMVYKKRSIVFGIPL